MLTGDKEIDEKIIALQRRMVFLALLKLIVLLVGGLVMIGSFVLVTTKKQPKK